ncbi:MAG: glycosyltransferase family 4 protein [Candidatus Hydrogenedentes bacterium]|nr:glycosyltransferase family 4 protein [Candidatus Hydrogenedentota bacterium]
MAGRTDKIRSLHINTERTWRGGEQQVYYLVAGLAQRGHPVTLVCQDGEPLHKRADTLPIEVVPMKVRGELSPAAVWRLRNIIRDRDIDIVHMHSPHAHTLGCAAATLAGRGVCIVTRRVDFSIRKSFVSVLKYKVRVNHYIAISHAIQNVMVHDGIDPSRISVVHSGIDLSRFDTVAPAPLRDELGLGPDTKLIGNVAHMADHKGQRYLVAAMPAILEHEPAAHLVIAGSGELRADLEKQVERLGLGRSVTFLGFRDDVAAIEKAFDVFVMSSHMEGLCTSILDAMACGTPVVATHAGGIPEIVRHEYNGLMVPARDPKSLAEAVVRMLDDRKLAERLAETARNTVIEQFTIDSMVEGNLAVYREMLADRHEPDM